MKCRPRKWLWFSVFGAGLPLLAAGWYSGKVEQKVLDNANAALKTSGNEWAKISVEGRDVSISGDGPSAETIAAAQGAVRNAYGVRTIAKNSIALVPPPPAVPFVAPTVQGIATNTDPAAITGTWPEMQGRSLDVTVGEKAYKLGTDKELASDGKGNWTLTLQGFKDGIHDIAVNAIDTGGEILKLAAPAKFVFDTVKPAAAAFAPLVAAAAPTAIAGTWPEADATGLKVTVTGKEGAQVFEKGKDAPLATDGKGAWTLTFPKPLAEGAYDLGVAVTDAAGNVTESAVKDAIVIDAAPPAAPVFQSMTVTGAASTTLAGTWAEGDATALSVKVDETPYALGTASELTSKEGQWTLALPAPLADGEHPVEVTTTDKAGNMSTVKGSVTVDNVPPPVPALMALPAFIKDKLTELTGKFVPAETKTLTVGLDGTDHTLGSSDTLASDETQGTWVLKLPEPLADGEHKLSVTVTDLAGNSAQSAAVFTIDTTPPEAPTVDALVTKTPAAAVTGRWDEAGTDSIFIGVDGRSFGSRSYKGFKPGDDGKSWSLALPEPLAEGEHLIEVLAADQVGNVSKSSGTIVVDTTPPGTPSVNQLVTKDPQQVVTGTWGEGQPEALMVEVGTKQFVFGSFPGLSRTATAGEWRLELPEPLGNGTHEIKVTTADRAGNAAGVIGTIVVDTVAPAMPTIDPVVATVSPVMISGTWPEGDAASLTITSQGKDYRLGTAGEIGTDGNGRWMFTPPEPFKDGAHDIGVTVADAAGNETVLDAKNAVVVDPRPAVPTVNRQEASAAKPVITGTFDEKGSQALSVTVGGQTAKLGDANLKSDGSGNWTFIPAEPLKDGYHDIVVTAMNAAGNAVKDETVAELHVDTTPPAAPTVNPAVALPLTGTYDAAGSATFKVSLASRTYTLGSDPELTADGGAWTLAGNLPPGAYDVEARSADALGNGINDATSAELVIPVPPPPGIPKVVKLESTSAKPVVTGTWEGKEGQSLSLAVGGKTYKLGTDAALTDDGAGNWSLTPSEALKDGHHDVVATVIDAFGSTSKDETVAELLIDTTPPAVPTVNASAAMPVTGGFASGQTAKLTVTFNGRAYTLGQDQDLTANGDAWTLAGEAAPGAYDIEAAASDALGNTAKDTTANELVVPPPPLAPPTVAKLESASGQPVITGTWEGKDGQSLAVAVGGKIYKLGSDAALAADGGNWSLTPSEALKDGHHDVVATVMDAFGSTSKDETVAELLIDTTPPAVPTVNPSAAMPVTGGFAAGDTAKLTVTFNGRTYTLGQDQDLTANGDAWTLAGEAAPGAYEIEVTATDALGNLAKDTTANELVIPLPPPMPPTVAALSTNQRQPVVNGAWDEQPSNRLSVKLGGATYVLGADPALQSDGAGKWSLAPGAELADGIYDVEAAASNAEGVTAVDATTAELQVDATPPAAPTVNPSAAMPVTGGFAAGDTAKLTVTFNGRTYTLGQDQDLTANGDAWTLAGEAAPGAYEIEVTATDALGNSAKDATANELVIPLPPPMPPTVAALSTNQRQPVVNGTWDEQPSNRLSVKLGGATYVLGADPALQSDGAGKWSLAPGAELADGIYDVEAAASNAEGVTAVDATTAELQVDATPPAAPTVNPSAAMPVTGGFAAGDTAKLTVTFNGRTYTLGQDPDLTANGDAWTLAGEAAPGAYEIEVTATDALGNSAKDATANELVIPLPPPMPPTVATLSTNQRQPVVNGTWDEQPSNRLSVKLGGATYVLGADPALQSDGAGKWSLVPGAELADGIYDAEVTASNADGVTATDATTADITVDATAPRAPAVNASTAMPVTGSFDAAGTSVFRVTLSGVTYTLGQSPELTANGDAWSLAASLPPGAYEVIAEAADGFGNTSIDGTASELVLAEPLVAPTVNTATETVPRPRITGFYDARNSASFSVDVAGRTYALGADAELTANGTEWTLAVAAPLKDGTYNVTAASTAANGQSLTDITSGELVVDAAGPVSPTIALYSGESSPTTIGGSWAEGDAVSLDVALQDKSFSLGKDAALTSDGAGRWTLQLAEALKPGSYDVKAVNTDARGRAASDQTRFEILVKEVKQAEQVPEVVKTVDCGFELFKLLTVSPINFDTDKWQLRVSEQPTIDKAAAIMGECKDARIEIGGHTDNFAPEAYNQLLSQRRANAVMRALIKAGVAEARLSAKGYGETKALASNETPEGRSINRRIEMLVVK